MKTTQHLYIVTPPKHQPEWPPLTQQPARNPDVLIALALLAISACVVVGGIVMVVL